MSQRDWLTLLALPAIFSAPAAIAEDYLTLAQAQQVLFPQAEAFTAIPVTLTDDQLKQIKTMAGVRQRTRQPAIWRAMEGGATTGWFFLDEVIGKHEYITYATAVSQDGHVLSVEVLSYRETHGGEVRDAKWREQFKNKTLADPFKLDKDVANISGATLSCRNILDGVKRLLVLHKLLLANA